MEVKTQEGGKQPGFFLMGIFHCCHASLSPPKGAGRGFFSSSRVELELSDCVLMSAAVQTFPGHQALLVAEGPLSEHSEKLERQREQLSWPIHVIFFKNEVSSAYEGGGVPT